MTKTSIARGRLLVASAAVLWSLGGVVTKGLAPLDGVTIAFYRSLFAGLGLLPFVPRAKWTFRPAKVHGQPTSSVWELRFVFTNSGTRVTPVEITP